MFMIRKLSVWVCVGVGGGKGEIDREEERGKRDTERDVFFRPVGITGLLCVEAAANCDSL